MMYNEKRKTEYIQYAAKIDKMQERIMTLQFKRTCVNEKRLKKDVCDWNANEIIDYYQSLVLYSLESLLVLHSHFLRYAAWCLDHTLIKDSQNHFEEIDRHILNSKCVNTSYLKQGIVTRDQLLGILETGGFVRNPYEKFIVLGMFEGVGGRGLLDFKDLSMDSIEGNKIKLIGRELEISDELIRYAKIASSEYKYQSYGDITKNAYGSFDEEDKRIVKRKEGCKELGDTGFTHRMVVNLERIKANNNDLPCFSQSMLFQSGRLAMIRKFMREDGTEPVMTIKQHLSEITYRYRTIQGIQRFCDKWSEFLYMED